MTDTILLYEELSLNSHPALQTELYDGWILRYADGYTKRANSINPLYPSALPLPEKIAECERRMYFPPREKVPAAHGLPAIYKLTDGCDPALDRELQLRGYAQADPTCVMGMDLRGREFPRGECVLVDHPDDEWINSFFAFEGLTDPVKMAAANRILENVRGRMLCGRVLRGGRTVACGSAVLERGYMALLNIVVDAPQRGRGYGREICGSLLHTARRLGAHTAYLQVVQANTPARALYASLGYKAMYGYWYRVGCRAL